MAHTSKSATSRRRPPRSPSTATTSDGAQGLDVFSCCVMLTPECCVDAGATHSSDALHTATSNRAHCIVAILCPSTFLALLSLLLAPHHRALSLWSPL